jgi:hypothetical protein
MAMAKLTREAGIVISIVADPSLHNADMAI